MHVQKREVYVFDVERICDNTRFLTYYDENYTAGPYVKVEKENYELAIKELVAEFEHNLRKYSKLQTEKFLRYDEGDSSLPADVRYKLEQETWEEED